jgi:hypothetical protein
MSNPTHLTASSLLLVLPEPLVLVGTIPIPSFHVGIGSYFKLLKDSLVIKNLDSQTLLLASNLGAPVNLGALSHNDGKIAVYKQHNIEYNKLQLLFFENNISGREQTFKAFRNEEALIGN